MQLILIIKRNFGRIKDSSEGHKMAIQGLQNTSKIYIKGNLLTNYENNRYTYRRQNKRKDFNRT